MPVSPGPRAPAFSALRDSSPCRSLQDGSRLRRLRPTHAALLDYDSRRLISDILAVMDSLSDADQVVWQSAGEYLDGAILAHPEHAPSGSCWGRAPDSARSGWASVS
jgi:hypothetical protein